uniref:Uncharacterized protein n=1 Tax=Arcella intermedia TaxID=1963864 RepID=A0A6B2LVN0_9EUKA
MLAQLILVTLYLDVPILFSPVMMTILAHQNTVTQILDVFTPF